MDLHTFVDKLVADARKLEADAKALRENADLLQGECYFNSDDNE